MTEPPTINSGMRCFFSNRKPIIPKICAIFLLLSVFSTSGCYYDVEEELYSDGICDTLSVTYTASIKPIMDSYSCSGCHADAAGKDLSTYNGVKAVVNSGRLLGSINHVSGFRPMPEAPRSKMPACAINKIQAWINQGMPN